VLVLVFLVKYKISTETFIKKLPLKIIPFSHEKLHGISESSIPATLVSFSSELCSKLYTGFLPENFSLPIIHNAAPEVYFSAHLIAASDARLSMKKPAVRGSTDPL